MRVIQCSAQQSVDSREICDHMRRLWRDKQMKKKHYAKLKIVINVVVSFVIMILYDWTQNISFVNAVIIECTLAEKN